MNKNEEIVLKAIYDLTKQTKITKQNDVEISQLAHEKGLSYKVALEALESLHKKGEIILVERFWGLSTKKLE